MSVLKAFFTGGILCLIGQIFIDYTRLTPARILVAYVCTGVILGFFGIYAPLIDFAGAGATVPLTGFGAALFKATKEAVDELGLLGVLSGGFTGASAGIGFAVLMSFLAAVFARPKEK